MHPNKKKKSKNLASSGYHPSHSIPPHPVLPSVAPHITGPYCTEEVQQQQAFMINKTKNKTSQSQSEQSTPIFPSLEPFRGEKEICLLDF